MKTLIKYFGNYKKQVIISPLFKLLEASFELIVPLIIASIIDKGILAQDKTFIYSRVLILGVFALVGFICAIVAQYFAAFASCGISSDLRFDLFKKIESLSIPEFEKLGQANVITSLTSDINQITNGINLFLRLLLRSPFIVVGATIMAFTISIKHALIFVSVVLLLSLFIFFNMRLTIPSYKVSRKNLDSLVSYTANGLSGVKVIRGYNRTIDDSEEFREKAELLNKSQLKAASLSSMLNPFTFLLINFAICFLIYRGAISVNLGYLSQGLVVALYNYMSQILVELIKFANLIVNVSKAIACASRVEDIITLKSESESKVQIDNPSEAHSVEFKNVSFTYWGNSEESISDISFKIEAGETIGVIGKTGSGKSTISQLIAGVYKPSKGEILIDNIPLNDISKRSLHNSVSLVLQKARMFGRSIKDNVRLNRDITEKSMELAYKTSLTTEIINGKPEGENYIIESSGVGLSGGQRQRIGIARGIAGNQGLIVFDDSTSALDAKTEKLFLENLKSIPNNPTKIIVSQKIKSVIDADRIMYIEDGKILAFAPHSELLKISDGYRELCDLQGGTSL